MKAQNLLIIYAAAALSLVIVGIAAVVTLIGPNRQQQSPDSAALAENMGAGAEPGRAGAGTQMDVPMEVEKVVFFASRRQPDLLLPAPRTIFNYVSLDRQAEQLLQCLMRGPEPGEGLEGTIPGGVTLSAFYIAEDGTAYVILRNPREGEYGRYRTEGLITHGGGATAEIMTIYSIVNTLCVNFPSIQRVQLSIEDPTALPDMIPAGLETLAGHIDITEPLTMREDLFAPGDSEPQPSEEQPATPAPDSEGNVG